MLAWTARGIEQTSGWQTSKLYDLACAVYVQRSQPLEVLRLRRTQHQRMPSLSTYTTLRRAANDVSAWEVERDAARAALGSRDLGALVDALLDDGDAELAWHTATADAAWDPGPDRWLRLAETRESDHPADPMGVYLRVVDEVLQTTDRRAYAGAVRILKRARAAASAANQVSAFDQHKPSSATSTAGDPP